MDYNTDYTINSTEIHLHIFITFMSNVIALNIKSYLNIDFTVNGLPGEWERQIFCAPYNEK